MGTSATHSWPLGPSPAASDRASTDRLRVASDTDATESIIATAEQRSHELWTTEPEVSLERRTALLADLSTIDAEIATICLAMITASGDHRAEQELLARARHVNAQLHALERAWSRPAA